MFVPLFYLDVIVLPSDVQLRVDVSPSQVANERGNEGERVLVAHCLFVDFLIVLHRSQLPILLLDEEERQSIRRDGWSNIPLCQLFVNEVVKSFVLSAGHGVDRAVNGIGDPLLEIDSVVPGPQGGEALSLLFAEH